MNDDFRARPIGTPDVALIALMIAGYRGDILLGILAGVVGCYCWALLWELINAGDWEPWDDE